MISTIGGLAWYKLYYKAAGINYLDNIYPII